MGGQTKLKIRLARLDCLIEQLAIVSIIWPGPAGICHCRIHTPTHTHIHSLKHVRKAMCVCVIFLKKVRLTKYVQSSLNPVCVCVCVPHFLIVV